MIHVAFKWLILILLGVLAKSLTSQGQEVRIKDLVNVRGIRTNQLTGLGLVVGLNKSGDSPKSLVTNRAAASMLTKLGIKTAETEISGGSVALVMVTVDLPTFTRSGDTVDVKVATVGDAKSLAGGTLVNTPLKGPDGQVYGFAHGATIVGQASGAGPQVLTAAFVPGGALVEREFTPEIDAEGKIVLSLKRNDFTTNRRIVEAINGHLHGFHAKSLDISAVEVGIPASYEGRTVEFIADIENLTIKVERKAIVVINERTGTVVMGGDVVIAPVTVAHGDLSIAVGGGGGARGKKSQAVMNFGGNTVSKLLEAMNNMGMKPADLIGVLQTLQAAGALQAELQFM